MFVEAQKLWSCCLGFSGMLSTCLGMQPTVNRNCLEKNVEECCFSNPLEQDASNNSPVESMEENAEGVSMSHSFATINFAELLRNEEDTDESELKLSSVKSLPAMNKILKSEMMRPVAQSVPAEFETIARGWNESHNSIWVGNFRIGNWAQVSTDMWNWLAFYYPGLTSQNLTSGCYDDATYKKKFFPYFEDEDGMLQRGSTVILQRKYDDYWTISSRIFCCEGFSVLTQVLLTLDNIGVILVEDLPQLYSFTTGSNKFSPPDLLSAIKTQSGE